jgi:hypothetical protein
MADLKISALPASTTPLAGTEVVPLVQSSTTKNVSVANLTAGRIVSASKIISGNTNAATSFTAGTSANAGPNIEMYGTTSAAPGWTVYTAGVTNFASFGIHAFYKNDFAGAATFLGGWYTNGDYNVNTGNLVIGTSGKGIDFSATSGTGTSELLADYEEGTFTPTWTPATGSGATVNNASGWYTKVGNRVTVDVYISTNGHGTSAGAITIGGLPFTSTANANQLGGFYLAQAANSGLGIGQMVAGRIIYNTTTFAPIAWGAAGGGTGTMTAAEWGVSGLYRFTGSYQTA